MFFEIVGEISEAQTFASGRAIHELRRLVRTYGDGRWRKRKGVAAVELENGELRKAEVHWYEATGIGRKEIKVKRYLE